MQTTKKPLKSVVGDGILNDLELRTLLAEVESIVNNRPITAVSDGPADFTALTPNRFVLQRATQLLRNWSICERGYVFPEAMEKGPVPCGSLLETLGTRVSAGSSKKTKMGQVKKKGAAWRHVAYCRG